MSKKDKKNLKNLNKKILDPDYLIKWIKENKIEIPDDWENRIKTILKELDDSISILVEKNNIYLVENHEIEMFIDLKAKIDGTYEYD
ncbi:MAG: hypothetical protein WBH31_13230 [Promethearchaeia archaeon]